MIMIILHVTIYVCSVEYGNFSLSSLIFLLNREPDHVDHMVHTSKLESYVGRALCTGQNYSLSFPVR